MAENLQQKEFIVCNGQIIALPSLEVVKPILKMEHDVNIDWLLHIYYSRGDFLKCKALIEQVLHEQLNPEYLYFVKGLIERDEGNNSAALKSLQMALDFNSKNMEAYKEVGKTLFVMGRLNQALHVFRKVEQLTPRADNEIFHYIGELLYRSAAGQSAAGQKQKALAKEEQAEAKVYFLKAVQCGKKLESFQRLAEIHRKEREYLKAIEVLEGALIYAPENTDILTEISVLYLKMGEIQRAFDRLLEVTNVDRNHARGLLALGAIMQSRNDVDAALGKYQQIAAIKPNIAELWNNIGLCFFKKRKFIAAISSLRKSVWLSPFNYNALYNISLIYITAEQYASAFHTLAAALNLRKDSSECYMLLGICLRKLGDAENALTAFERSSDIALREPSTVKDGCENRDGVKNGVNMPNHPLIHLNFALFLYERGRFALATKLYNRFLSTAEGLALPTEYKFQATKLKSLLKLSTGNILMSTQIIETTEDDVINQADIANRAENVQKTEKMLVKHDSAVHKEELKWPLEVNAVVSPVLNDKHYFL